MPSSDATIRSIEFIDARDPDGRPMRLGIGTTEGNNVVLTCRDHATVLAPGQMPQVQKLMREAFREVTVEPRDEL